MAEDKTEMTLRTALYEFHSSRANKEQIVPFGGYLMPLWYDSITGEHRAVREAAGLFDCAHMGTVKIEGEGAADFIQYSATNDVGLLEPMGAQYSYLLDDAGKVIDDIIVYRFGEASYLLVVNAGNQYKVWDWFAELKGCERFAGRNFEIKNLKDESSGGEQIVDIALQGPASDAILKKVLKGESFEEVSKLKSFTFCNAWFGDTELIVSRTGYTGSKCGYELLVHPEAVLAVWEKLMDVGVEDGLKACGLGSRDSLRIEAGLPLYGHELAGDFEISPIEAGYRWAVKFESGDFVGKEALCKGLDNVNMDVMRLKLDGRKGVRPVRFGDAVISAEAGCIGWITSCAKVGDEQVGLAYLRNDMEPNDISVYYLARTARQAKKGRSERVEMGEKAEGDIEAKKVSRFERF
jgi:glycine hydroxymethyltransferase